MTLVCTLCDKQFDSVPVDAVKGGKRRGSTQVFRFSDGTIHNLISTKVRGALGNAGGRRGRKRNVSSD